MTYPKECPVFEVVGETRVCEGVDIKGPFIVVRHADDCDGCRRGNYYAVLSRYMSAITDSARAMLAIARGAK